MMLTITSELVRTASSCCVKYYSIINNENLQWYSCAHTHTHTLTHTHRACSLAPLTSGKRPGDTACIQTLQTSVYNKNCTANVSQSSSLLASVYTSSQQEHFVYYCLHSQVMRCLIGMVQLAARIHSSSNQASLKLSMHFT